jgi:hypothetical protein
MQMQADFAAMREQMAAMEKRLAALETAELFGDAPVKRGPGRPRKEVNGQTE